jgi:hypothetical protein
LFIPTSRAGGCARAVDARFDIGIPGLTNPHCQAFTSDLDQK